MNALTKYRFAFLGVAAVFLFVFSIVLSFNKDFAEQIILYTTAGVLFVFGIIRFIPLMKYLTDKRRLIMNAIEIFSNLIIGGIMVYIAMNSDNATLISLYRFLLAIVLYARGVIFLVEAIYCDGETEVLKFIIHLGFIICATVVISLAFDLEKLKWLIIAIALLAGVYCVGDSYVSFNRYRKLYANQEEKVNKKKAKKVEEQVNVPQPEEREEAQIYS